MALDYIPPADDDWSRWFGRFVKALLKSESDKLSWINRGELEEFQKKWDAAFKEQKRILKLLPPATAEKNSARASAEAIVRRLVKVIQLIPGITDDFRRELGITIAAPKRKRIPAPKSRPVITKIDFSKSGEHLLYVHDEHNPKSRRKPYGVIGVQVWHKVGEGAPNSVKECELLTVSRKSVIRLDHRKNKGALVHYFLRWENNRGEYGPLSAVASATVAA